MVLPVGLREELASWSTKVASKVDHWTEIRTAYYVAKLGTISAAAQKLKLHRATVMRHVDLLEERLEVKLFQRHQAGYTPTEYGEQLFEVAGKAEADFLKAQSQMTVQSETVSGKLIVTSTAMLLSTFAPVIRQYQIDNPDVRVEYNVSQDVVRLEVGEAHVAIRTGSYQQAEDTIMLPLVSVRSAMYAHESYVERYGKPESVSDFKNHRFVSRVLGREGVPLFRWLNDQVDPENLVFMSDDSDATTYAVLEGIGIGFLPIEKAKAWPELVEVLPYNPEWNVDFWLVTHIDNHQMPKIRALISTFRQMGLLTKDEGFSDILPAKTTT